MFDPVPSDCEHLLLAGWLRSHVRSVNRCLVDRARVRYEDGRGNLGCANKKQTTVRGPDDQSDSND